MTKEELKEEWKIYNGDQVGDEMVADWWLDKFDLYKKELKEATMKMYHTFPKDTCINAEMRMFGRCFDCEKNTAYNEALTDLLKLIDDK